MAYSVAIAIVSGGVLAYTVARSHCKLVKLFYSTCDGLVVEGV